MTKINLSVLVSKEASQPQKLHHLIFNKFWKSCVKFWRKYCIWRSTSRALSDLSFLFLKPQSMHNQTRKRRSTFLGSKNLYLGSSSNSDTKIILDKYKWGDQANLLKVNANVSESRTLRCIICNLCGKSPKCSSL